MVVFVEGNEGVGKTTLIDTLFAKIKFVRVKYIKGMKVLDLFRYMANDDVLYIVDRCFISDMVYRYIDKQKSVNNLFDIAYFMHVCSDNIKFIFCNNANAFENSMIRGEKNIVTKAQHLEVETGFSFIEQLIKNFTDIKIFDYDYDYSSIDDVIKFIKEGWNESVSL